VTGVGLWVGGCRLARLADSFKVVLERLCAPQVRFPGLWLNAVGVAVENWKPRKQQGFLKRLVGNMALLQKNYKNAVLLLLFYCSFWF